AREQFGLELAKARLAFGYSLGEVTALVASGVYEMSAVLSPLVALADDAASLAHDVQLGVLFSRRVTLDVEIVERMCTEITSRGAGTVGVSAHLAPNAVLLMGQRDSLEQFRLEIPNNFDG